ncbi:MAG: methionyl-tRNA formyltransferase [Candidatus Latescibacterota bacterium]
MMNMIYFGNGPRGVKCLQALLDANHTIRAVIGQKAQTDVMVLAQKHGLPTFFPQKINDPAFVDQLRQMNPDLFVLSGYNQILHSEIIQIPRLGALNLHGGKLPDYKGTAPINWQIIRGETKGGCCVLFVDEGIDTGDIVEQAYYDIGPNDTAEDLVKKQLLLFPSMLLNAISALQKGTLKRHKQDPLAGAYFTRRYPKDSHLNWQQLTAQEAHNLIRAMQGAGYPPAFSFYKGEKIELYASRIIQENIQGAPGRIALKRKEGVIVIAKDRGLLLTQIVLKDGSPQNPRRLLDMGEDLI